MTMLRPIVLLSLVASAVLEQTLVSAHPDMVNVMANDTLSRISDVPTCAADYQRMSIERPRFLQKRLTGAHAICVRAKDGAFVTAVWKSNPEFVYLFNRMGWMMKLIELPKGTTFSTGCTFTNDKLFYANTRGDKILQFSSDGLYEKEFATGSKFLRLTTRENLLYTTIEGSKEVRAYDTNTGEVVYSFETINHDARGLAFTPKTSKFLLVSTWSNIVGIALAALIQ